MASMVACVVLVMCMVMVIAPMAESAVTCENVANKFFPCVGFSGGIWISSECCNAVKRVDDAATTAADRHLTCRCLKQLAGYIQNLNPIIGDNLFVGICGAKTPYKLNPNADCSTYSIKTEEVVADAGLSNILTIV